MKKIFQPFAIINKQTFLIMVLLQVVLALGLWHIASDGLMPQPGKVLAALASLSATKTLIDNVLVSLALTVKAMLYAIVITLVIAYLSVLPFFKGIALFIVKCRYLTLAGLIFVFTLLTQNGSALKLWLLIFGIVPFFVTSFLSVIVHIPRQEYDLCKVLGYNKWRTLYEVIIIGKADKVLEILQHNFAIAWLMITMVEGLNMSEGGIGALLIKYNKYNDLTNVLALQLLIFLLGLFFDYLLAVIRSWLFPYTRSNKTV
ncbi:ABC transporter permease [Chitinophaga sp. S165]|uniref:ABC transporter permease n=1 Tax=Chitinophaga sp. S165 TaxID=2135462 RepID=UPI000D70E59C|nr:nitrate ABC transporter permease [Chitinophaga sp. S165]PWV56905.1 NitT/TauT family transport system permease protein [Chitinophaga sp. S165]